MVGLDTRRSSRKDRAWADLHSIWLDQIPIRRDGALRSSPIYIPIWLDQILVVKRYIVGIIYDLHSNMVGLDTKESRRQSEADTQFTFQYGWIRYIITLSINNCTKLIYIPIWLDQILLQRHKAAQARYYLHSNMVGLDTCQYRQPPMPAELIYIPIWLDQIQLTKEP